MQNFGTGTELQSYCKFVGLVILHWRITLGCPISTS